MTHKIFKVLIVTDWLYPKMSANSEIAYRIAERLQKDHGCAVCVAGIDKNEGENNSDLYDTIRLTATTNIEKWEMIEKKRDRIIQACIHPFKYKLMWLSKIKKEHYVLLDYKETLKKTLQTKDIDCVLAFGMPFESIIALSKIKSDIPYIFYKLEPWASMYYNTGNRKILETEKECERNAAAIITTRLILNDAKSYSDIETVNKTIILEYPNIVRYTWPHKPNKFSDKAIHCVFCGSLYQNIRNPQYVLDLFREIDDNIVLHIFGRLRKGLTLTGKLSDNIIYHGNVSNEEAISYMQSADVLVNIGNTEENLMPSKLLTYISLGKPILNIMKTNNCPTVPYMEKYPLGLSILETPSPRKEDIEIIRKFIVNSCGSQIGFSTIEKLFFDCTPKYVGDKVYKIIELVGSGVRVGKEDF